MQFAIVEFQSDKSLEILDCKQIQSAEGDNNIIKEGCTCVAKWRKPGSKKDNKYPAVVLRCSGKFIIYIAYLIILKCTLAASCFIQATYLSI